MDGRKHAEDFLMHYGMEAMPDDFLMHWKYIKRERKNGKWVYTYPYDPVGRKNTALTSATIIPDGGGGMPTLDWEKQKIYAAEQEKERTEVRKPELEAQLQELNSKTFFGLGKSKNPLPSLSLKTEATTLDEDMALVNPNFSWDSDNLYNQNCAFCTLTYDLRRRGYDVVANAEIPLDDAGEGTTNLRILDLIDLYDLGEESFIDRWVNLNTLARDNNLSKSDITCEKLTELTEAKMLSYGEGARGNLCLYWHTGSGHSVVWEIENGEVVIRDCQTNKKYKLIEYTSLCSSWEFFRTDDLTPNEKILDYVHNRKE